MLRAIAPLVLLLACSIGHTARVINRDFYGSEDPDGFFAKVHTAEGRKVVLEFMQQKLVKPGDDVAFLFETPTYLRVWGSWITVTRAGDFRYQNRKFVRAHTGTRRCSLPDILQLPDQDRIVSCYENTDEFVEAFGNGSPVTPMLEVALTSVATWMHKLSVIDESMSPLGFLRSLPAVDTSRKDFEALTRNALFWEHPHSELNQLAALVLRENGWMVNASRRSGWSQTSGFAPVLVNEPAVLRVRAGLDRLNADGLEFASDYFLCPTDTVGVRASQGLGSCIPADKDREVSTEFEFFSQKLEEYGYVYDEMSKRWSRK